MKTNIFIIFTIIASFAHAQHESGGFADTSVVYLCKDVQNNYEVILQKLGPKLLTLSVIQNKKEISAIEVAKNKKIQCFAPCDIYENIEEQVDFSVTDIGGSLSGLYSSSKLSLELVCARPKKSYVECDSRNPKSPCH
jgi:hypothetical protein